MGPRHDADEDQHDQAHAFLPIVGAVKKAHQRAGEDKDKGDSSNASPTSFAFDQSTPDVPLRPWSNAFATPIA